MAPQALLAPSHVDPELARTLGLGRSRTARRWLVRAGLLVGLALLAAGFVIWRQAVAKGRLPDYQTAVVKRGDLSVVVSATGTLQPLNQVEVGAEISGRILRVLVDYNDQVKRGQVLAELDTEQLRARRDEGLAQLNAAQAQLEQARASALEGQQHLKRTRELAANGAVTARELELAVAAGARADAALASARAQVAIAIASLSSVKTNLTRARVLSPIDGVVLARRVEPGQTVVAAFQAPVLFTIAEDLTRMRLHLDVDEADIGRVHEGQHATFTVDAYPDVPFDARLVMIRNAPRSVQGVVSYEAVLTVDNPERLLRPGMTATAEIRTEAVKGALLVPNAALRFVPPDSRPRMGPGGAKVQENHGARVWRMEAGKPVPVPVKTGVSDGTLTELRGAPFPEGTLLAVDVKAGP